MKVREIFDSDNERIWEVTHPDTDDIMRIVGQEGELTFWIQIDPEEIIGKKGAE